MDGIDIHHSKKNLETAIKRITVLKDGYKVVRFLEHLQASGLSSVRVLKYATCMPKILGSFEDIERAQKPDFERFVSQLNQSNYKAWTKQGYKMTLKKYVQFLRYGATSKEIPFPEEVAWIKTRVSDLESEKESRVSPDRLLSAEDVTLILRAARNPRDEAMLSVLYEGAFRPGELLSMRVGSVQFLQDYCVVSTRGKTGQKRIPLVVSHRPLLRWLSEHPLKGNSAAPLWCALDTGHTGHQLTYQHFRTIVRDTASRAGLASKMIWPYLFRHSQLTNMADKLTDSKLTLFAGWTMGSSMTRRYVHWSGRDLDQSLLAIHGLVTSESQKKQNCQFEVVACPRCEKSNPPSSPRCESCGFILDKKLAIEVEDDLQTRVDRLEGLVRGALQGAGPSTPSQPRT